MATDVGAIATGIGSIRSTNAQQADAVAELTAALASFVAAGDAADRSQEPA